YMHISQINNIEEVLGILETTSSHSMIIVDWELLEEKGGDIVKKIRTNQKGLPTSIVMTTKDLNPSKKHHAVELGVNLCITKPIQIRSLIEGLKEMMIIKVDKSIKEMEERIEEVKKQIFELGEEEKKTGLIYLETINTLEGAREIYPWSTHPHYQMGMIYQKMGFFNDAVQSFEMALNIDENNKDACLGVARLLVKRRQWNRLVKILVPFVSRVHFPVVTGILGEAYLMLNDNDNAIKAFNDSIKLSDEKTTQRDMAKNYDGLGLAYQNKFNETSEGKWQEKAIDSFNQAVKYDPDYISAHFNLYCVYKKIGNKEKTTELLKTLATIIPENSEDWILLGKQFLDVENYTKAEFSFKRAIEKSKELQQAYYEIGDAYSEVNIAKALKLLDKSIELDSNQPHVLNKRGILYRKKGLTPVAIKNYREALKIDPNDEVIYYNLALALLENHDVNSRIMAAKNLKKAIELREDFSEAQALLKKISSH
ncbi:MAG: tetratricopeptide repeat protein, partial [Nitrospinae bacterium]|nr:tetratricopeptide repeat protein [Nitrospinota bacterium]